MWAGPLARLSLPSIMSWIRPDTLIWKLALSQSCSHRIKVGRKIVKCFIKILVEEWNWCSMFTVNAVWNTGETGDINSIYQEIHKIIVINLLKTMLCAHVDHTNDQDMLTLTPQTGIVVLSSFILKIFEVSYIYNLCWIHE